ncbi:hypothetical protein OSB04_001869 [Centaurea solstitialis]|uniref:Uncharacterized protein n=1 Tax=Centaurea solstitialis TaxID=347529 RepID=A0AA38TRS6_9ASTR|nr:hypothetical protein OSB04_001869 [Centaurea solstitialis]
MFPPTVMNVYTSDSYIEQKDTAIVWHHEDADRGVGWSQARELSDHLRSLLANQPVVVSRGRFIVKAKPPDQQSWEFLSHIPWVFSLYFLKVSRQALEQSLDCTSVGISAPLELTMFFIDE